MSYKKLKAKYANICKKCKSKINVGETIFWNPDTKIVLHKRCLTGGQPRSAQPQRTSLTYPFSGSYRNGRKK